MNKIVIKMDDLHVLARLFPHMTVAELIKILGNNL